MLLQSLHTTLVESWQINHRDAHYLYGWLVHYFNTNHAVDPSPLDVEARRVIHEGSDAKVGCTMLNKNKNTFYLTMTILT
ncbi:hypothetical protein RDABS01_017875 [Bienertia sinuspersici]